MRHLLSLPAFLTLTMILSAATVLGADQPANPSPRITFAVPAISAASPPGKLAAVDARLPKTCTTKEKLKEVAAQLGRTLDLAVDLLSGNEADLLSKNKTALLSGNCPALLSGNAPKLLSENETPVLSGNRFSFLSNIKIEINISNSGNTVTPGAPAQPSAKMIPLPEPTRPRTPGR